MKYAITISDMTDAEYRQVIEFVSSMKFGGRPVQLVGTGEIGAAEHITTAQVTQAVANVAPALTGTTGERDDNGVPYNPEFHSAAKTKIKGGSWKLKKGGDRNAADAYAAQFTGKSTQPSVITPTVPAHPGIAPVTTFAPPPPPPVLGFPAGPAPVDYNTFFEFASGLMTSGKLSMDNLAQLNAVCGVADASAYQTNDAARAAAYQHLKAQFPN